MKVYLAARYPHMAKMVEWAGVLEASGHTITSQWIKGAEEQAGMTEHQKAVMDLDDVAEADVLISEVHPYGYQFQGGGRHVEYGYALAMGKIILNVGDGSGENVFHRLDSVVTVPSIEAAVSYLETCVVPPNALSPEAAATNPGGAPTDGRGLYHGLTRADPDRGLYPVVDGIDQTLVRTIKWSHDERGNFIIDPSKAPFDGKPILVKTSAGWAQAEWVKPTGYGEDSEGFYWDMLEDKDQLEIDEVKLWAPLPGTTTIDNLGAKAFVESMKIMNQDVLKDPELIGFLYDADMLPEQCVTPVGAIHLVAVCALWKKLTQLREKYDAVAGLRIEPHVGMQVWAHALQDAKAGDLIKVSFQKMEPIHGQ